MKTAILIADGVKQIMFTPENDTEKEALSLITPNDDMHCVIKEGTFSSILIDPEVFGANVYKCSGGYYRAEEKPNSVMIVLTPKKKLK